MKFLKFSRKQTERGYEILKFLGARGFGLRAAELLNLTPAPSRNGFRNLKFTPVPRNRFEILKFTLASARLTSQHTYNATEKRRAVKLTYAGGYLNSARRYIARFCSAAVRHGYEVGRAEKFSKFDFTGALLKFTREPLRNGFGILKFTLAPHKFKPAPAVRLNFALNSIPPASASKFENGVKFKGAAKFERSAR